MRLQAITVVCLCLTSLVAPASDEYGTTSADDTGPRAVVCESIGVPGTTSIDIDKLGEQIPVMREVDEVVLLTPGTVRGDTAFDGRTPGQDLVSIGGASVAENRYTVNGLNITNARNGLGSTMVPFEFLENVTVAAGGVDAAYGGFTGGLVAMETKKGSNNFHGSVSAYFEPSDLQGRSPEADRLSVSFDEGRTLEVNGSLGGPIVRDRLFFFGFVQYVDSRTFELTGLRPATGEIEYVVAVDSRSATPYWGGTLDWNVGMGHRVEGMVLSDDTELEARTWFFEDPFVPFLDRRYPVFERRGGLTGLIKYQGQLVENVILSASYGENRFERTDRYSGDESPYTIDSRWCPWPTGKWRHWSRSTAHDQLREFRVDAETFLGAHKLRAGVDVERNSAFDTKEYSGGVHYRYFNGSDSPTGEGVRVRHYWTGGDFDTETDAAFVQDDWAITPGLSLKAGLRWERYRLSDGLGGDLTGTDSQWSPRLGFVWDPGADGRTKVYGSFGRYTSPLPASAAIVLAGAENFDEAFFVWDGSLNPDYSPVGYVDCGFGHLAECGNQGSVGDLMEYTIRFENLVADPRELVANDLEPLTQHEIILGVERLVGGGWSLGVRGVYRDLEDAIEDFTIDAGLFRRYGLCDPEDGGCFDYRLGNPGSDFDGWYDVDGDGMLDPIHLTRDELGYPGAERTYYALELTFKRRFADNWMLQGSYTWSHLYGNTEGLIRSDIGDDRAAQTSLYDFPGLTEYSSGNLPQDRRHNLKIFGAYAFDTGWSVGSNIYYLSGRPINALGVHPGHDGGFAALYGAVSFFNQGEPAPRGCCGTTDDVFGLDLMVRYEIPLDRLNLFWRLDVFNVTNRHSVTEVDEGADQDTGAVNPDYGVSMAYQRPRRVRLGFGLNF